MKLPNVFTIEKMRDPEADSVGDSDPYSYGVTLAPVLADYYTSIQYDARGNANITIWKRADTHSPIIDIEKDTVVLDFCLDNGEINEIDATLFDVVG